MEHSQTPRQHVKGTDSTAVMSAKLQLHVPHAVSPATPRYAASLPQEGLAIPVPPAELPLLSKQGLGLLLGPGSRGRDGQASPRPGTAPLSPLVAMVQALSDAKLEVHQLKANRRGAEAELLRLRAIVDGSASASGSAFARENAAMSHQLAAITSQLHFLHNEVAEKDAKLAEAAGTLGGMAAELARLRKVEKQHIIQKEVLRKSGEARDALRAKVAEMEEQLADREWEKQDRITTQLESFKGDMAAARHMRDQLNDKERGLNVMRQMYADESQRNAVLSQRMDALQKLLSEADERAASLGADLQAKTSEANAATAELAKQADCIRQLQQEVKGTRAAARQTSDLQAMQEGLQRTTRRSQAEAADLRAKVAELEPALQQARERIDEQRQEVRSLRSRSTQLEDSMRAKADELASLRARLDQYMDRVAASQAVNEELQAQAKASASERDAAIRELDKLRDQLAELRRVMGQLRDQHHIDDGRVHMSEADGDAKIASNVSLEMQVGAVMTELAVLGEIGRRYAALSAEHKVAALEVDQLASRCATLTGELDDKQAKIQALELKQDQDQEEAARLKAALQHAQHDMRCVRQELQQRQSALEVAQELSSDSRKALEEELATALQRNRELQAEVSQERLKVAQQAAAMEDLNAAATAQADLLVGLKADQMQARAECDKALAERASCEVTLERLFQRLEDTMGALQAQRSTLLRTQTQMQALAQGFLPPHTLGAGADAQAEAGLEAKIAERLGELEAFAAETSRQADSEQANSSQLRQRLDAFDQRAQQAEASFGRMQAAMADAAAATRDELDRRAGRVAALEGERGRVGEELAAAKRRAEELRTELDVARENLRLARAMHLTEQARCKQEAARVIELQASIQALQLEVQEKSATAKFHLKFAGDMARRLSVVTGQDGPASQRTSLVHGSARDPANASALQQALADMASMSQPQEMARPSILDAPGTSTSGALAGKQTKADAARQQRGTQPTSRRQKPEPRQQNSFIEPGEEMQLDGRMSAGHVLQLIGLPLSQNQVPQLYCDLLEVCELLRIPHMPELYVVNSREAALHYLRVPLRPFHGMDGGLGFQGSQPATAAPSTSSFGPALVLTSSLVDLLAPDELRATFAAALRRGQEVVRSYAALATAVSLARLAPGQLLSTLPGPLRVAWHTHTLPALQKAGNLLALSSDRWAATVGQSPRAVASAIVKVAAGSCVLADELNLDSVLQQAASIDEAQSAHLAETFRTQDGATITAASNSFAILRIRELLRWAAKLTVVCRDRERDWK
ncbi:hypothetical protein WJX72_008501 [[Myrmecia] bisecta]|uniref:G protein gamma domain-containing protein n=1 Tax=[Myrmecia] bisecta TaxID=41462 RepID=A0AAW1PM10_9CHLO